MVLKIDHPLVSLWMKLPSWFGYIENVRVGQNYTDFCKISFWR